MKSNQKQAPEVYKKVGALGQGSYGKAYLVECQSDKVSFTSNFIFLIDYGSH
jgi:hypothetical protein